MRKILVVSGCSWTDKNFTSMFHPEMDCSWPKWPELLSEKLDMDCVNLGKSGSGNEYIYSTLLDYLTKNKLEDIGLVISGWTRAPRRDYSLGNKWWNLRCDTKGDMEYFIMKSMRYYYSLQEICKGLNVPLKQIQILNPYESAPYKEEHDKRPLYSTKETVKIFMSNGYSNKIDDTNFIGWPVVEKIGGFSIRDILDKKCNHKEYFISDLDWHPSEKGQKLITELIYDNL